MTVSPRMCFCEQISCHDKQECWQTCNAFQRPNTGKRAISSSWISSHDLVTFLMTMSNWNTETRVLNDYDLFKKQQINHWHSNISNSQILQSIHCNRAMVAGLKLTSNFSRWLHLMILVEDECVWCLLTWKQITSLAATSLTNWCLAPWLYHLRSQWRWSRNSS